ncbi:MAG: sirohydrochlorin chelatase [Myxococcota bacterium]
MSAPRAILLVDHGSRRDEANAQLEAVAEALRARLRDRGDRSSVHVAHLEIAEPDFAAGVAACLADGAREIVVHPYFLSPGRHGSRDIPERVEAARRSHPDVEFRLTALLGEGGRLADAVLARVDEAVPPAEDRPGAR